MGLSFGLGVGLNQSQKLTPQMQQAIRLLALSHLELEQEVQMKLDSNPLLEQVDESFEVEFDRDELSLDDWTDNNWQKNDSQDSDGFDEPFESDSYDKLTESGWMTGRWTATGIMSIPLILSMMATLVHRAGMMMSMSFWGRLILAFKNTYVFR